MQVARWTTCVAAPTAAEMRAIGTSTGRTWRAHNLLAKTRATDFVFHDDEDVPYPPAWQERYTGIHRDTLIKYAREWGRSGGDSCLQRSWANRQRGWK